MPDDTSAEKGHASSDAALARAERIRELLLATLGHDLRNPLNTVVLGCNLLTAAQEDARRQSTIKRMMNGAMQIERLIQQSLFLVQSLFEPVPLERANMDLGAACDALSVEFLKRHPGLTIARLGDATSMGEWDFNRLNQVIENLLANATHYGDGSVTITLEDQEVHSILKVHNSGRPMDALDLETIFDPFSRLETRSSREGLGLYIVAQIVRAHGGGVDVSSNELEGTTFVVRLPKKDSRDALQPNGRPTQA